MAFPKFEDWKAPWEESGEEFDAAKAKKRIYDLSKDKHSQGERIQSLRTEVSDLKDERDDLTDERDALAASKGTKESTSTEGDDDKVAKAVAAALAAAGIKPKSTKEQRKEAEQADEGGFDIEKARLEIALEKGLTKAQAARLVGTNAEELAADADAYMEEHGLSGASEGGNGGEEGQAPPSQRAKVRTGTRQGSREVDPYEGLTGDELYDKVYGTGA